MGEGGGEAPKSPLGSEPTIVAPKLSRRIGDIADGLSHAFMIEPDRHLSRAQVDGDTITHNHRLRMVDLESVTTHKLNRERLKWRTLAERLEEFFKVIGCHNT